MSSVGHIKRENEGIPVVATPSRYTAPVHIDVGGKIYTSSLDTLTKFPESKLSKMFTGSIPIVLDTLKQHYFIDRDGEMFKHILNYMRTGRSILPDNFGHLELLLEEARYYELQGLVTQLTNLHKKTSSLNNGNLQRTSTNTSPTSPHTIAGQDWEVVALNVSPEMGERIMISGVRETIEEMFPEISSTLQDTRHSLAWNTTSKYVIRFPLNGYCKVTTLQVISQLLSHQFSLAASNGGGVEATQHFSEYLFTRLVTPR